MNLNQFQDIIRGIRSVEGSVNRLDARASTFECQLKQLQQSVDALTDGDDSPAVDRVELFNVPASMIGTTGDHILKVEFTDEAESHVIEVIAGLVSEGYEHLSSDGVAVIDDCADGSVFDPSVIKGMIKETIDRTATDMFHNGKFSSPSSRDADIAAEGLPKPTPVEFDFSSVRGKVSTAEPNPDTPLVLNSRYIQPIFYGVDLAKPGNDEGVTWLKEPVELQRRIAYHEFEIRDGGQAVFSVDLAADCAADHIRSFVKSQNITKFVCGELLDKLATYRAQNATAPEPEDADSVDGFTFTGQMRIIDGSIPVFQQQWAPISGGKSKWVDIPRVMELGSLSDTC